jgi:hypothetical protein
LPPAEQRVLPALLVERGACVVARRHGGRVEPGCPVDERRELEVGVAVDARDRRPSAGVFVDEVLQQRPNESSPSR